MKFSRRIIAVAAGGIVLAASAGTALAASAPKTLTACARHNVPQHIYRGGHSCPPGQARFTWNSRGPKGSKGDRGPSGVVSTAVHDLGSVASVATGGSFVTNSTEVGTISLKAGTYLISVNAKATPTAPTGDVQIFPQFFVYNQVPDSSFAGDLFNVGSGALENGTHATIDSYFSGSSQITLPAAKTLHFEAFGYDSDQGASSFNLEDLTVTVTRLAPAGA